MKDFKITGEINSQQVFISEFNWLKIIDKKNVTQWFRDCVVNLYKGWNQIIRNSKGIAYVISAQKIKDDNLIIK
jgi:hypothetical protein